MDEIKKFVYTMISDIFKIVEGKSKDGMEKIPGSKRRRPKDAG